MDKRNFISSSLVLHNEFSAETWEEKLGMLIRNTNRDSDVFAVHLHIILVSIFGHFILVSAGNDVVVGDVLSIDLVSLSEI